MVFKIARDLFRDVEYEVQSVSQMVHDEIEILNGYVAQYNILESKCSYLPKYMITPFLSLSSESRTPLETSLCSDGMKASPTFLSIPLHTHKVIEQYL